MERIGIYGGTFDPPHLGHLRAAQAAIDGLQLDRLLLLPASCSPGKTAPQTPDDHRLEMLRLAAGDKMEVCDLELQRGGVSYTVDTLKQLHAMYPDAKLHLCLGSDAFLNLDSWKDPEGILALAELCVFCRGGKTEALKVSLRGAGNGNCRTSGAGRRYDCGCDFCLDEGAACKALRGRERAFAEASGGVT